MTNTERIPDTNLAAIAKGLKTKITQAQGDVIRLIAKSADYHGITDVRAFSYVLATAYHEARWKSIPEIRAQKGSDVWKMQERYWSTGFYGRGLSQITWDYNYKKFGELLGIDLFRHPDLALTDSIGSGILVAGMAKGMFTGKSLDMYFKPNKEADWNNARRIVNGTFMADKVSWAAWIIYRAIAPENF